MARTSSLAFILATLNLASALRFLGRVNEDTRQLTWPSTGVTFAFSGTSATIDIASFSGENSAELTVDDREPIIIRSVTSAISTPSDLADGNHVVSLRKRSEAQYGTFSLGDITTTGTFLPGPFGSGRLIEVIGDSISVGYGLDGVLPCVDSAALQNNPATYAAVAARNLSADYSVIAWSGKGLVRNIASSPQPGLSPLVPDLWTRQGALDPVNGTYDFPADRVPQVVIINLGTNDFSYFSYDANGAYRSRENLDPVAFTDGLVSFVQLIRSTYGDDTLFLLLNSPMLNDSYPTAEDAQKSTQTAAIREAVAQLLAEGAKAQFVDWPSQGSEVGCDYHPSAGTNAAEAEVLIKVLSEILGW